MEKSPLANAGDTGNAGLIPAWERSPREGNDDPLLYSCLENPKNRGSWQATYSSWASKELDMTEHAHNTIYKHHGCIRNNN